MNSDFIRSRPKITIEPEDTPPKHNHKWFPFQVKNAFEPSGIDQGHSQTYHLVEYMYFSCNCGAGKKSVIQLEDK